MDIFANYYMGIKVFHIVAFMSWMAMLFYLPRLFVYHVEHCEKKEFVNVVEIQERLLYKAIGFPAFLATLASGILLILANTDLLMNGWFHVKIVVLVLLTAYSFSLEYYRNQLLNGSCKRSGKFFRAYNEVPTALSILIVTYVVMKNFYPIFTIGVLVVFAIICYVIMNYKKKKI
jgi:putative membrane protein